VPKEAVIRAVDLQKWYGDLHVLKGISLEVTEGEVLCIIGPSGSGKSTFLRCINQLEEYQEGSLYVGDELIGYKDSGGKRVPLKESEKTRQRRRLGMVFQGFNLFWHKTVMENMIEAPILVLGHKEDDARKNASALLDRVGLSGKENVFPGRLSGGQQQRAAIARALAMNPEVMLFDEPTSAIDPETTGEVLDVMTQLAKSGMTMVVVTHEMGFAKRVSDRAVMMEDGDVKYEAPTSEFFDRSRNERLDAFLSSME
jgi:polar amino acid transport system ATP-binding protein